MRWMMQPVCFWNLLANDLSVYAAHSITLSRPSPFPIDVGTPLPAWTVAAVTANAVAIAATTADRKDVSLANPPHVPSFSISYVCSGRHERPTRFPCSERASCEDVSRFCRTTTSTPPESRSTT